MFTICVFVQRFKHISLQCFLEVFSPVNCCLVIDLPSHYQYNGLMIHL